MCEKPVRIKLKGLDPLKTYAVEGEKRDYTGEELMYGGIVFDTPYAMGDFKAKMVHIKDIKES